MKALFTLTALILTASIADARPHRFRSQQEGRQSQQSPSQPQVESQTDSEQISYQSSESSATEMAVASEAAVAVGVVNRYRAQAGLHPLALDAQLSAYAENWSREMASSGFRHSTGWVSFGGLEVIAAGYHSPEDVVRGWMNSRGHRDALMSPSVNRFGLGHHGSQWTGLTGR